MGLSHGCGCGLERDGCLYPHCPDGDADQCDHIDYDADILTGMATCADCGERWMQTSEEIAAQQRRYAAYDAYIAKYERRERIASWLRPLAFWRRRRKPALIDDEIPF